MPNSFVNLLSASRFVLMFALVFVFLPYKTTKFREDDLFLDRVFISLTRSVFAIVLLVHVLGLSRLYDTFSAIGGLAIIVLLVTRRKDRSIADEVLQLGVGAVSGFLDFVEDSGSLASAGAGYLRSRLLALKETALGLLPVLVNPLAGLPAIAALGVSAYLRFSYSLGHAAAQASDMYTHLLWVKFIDQNDFYKGGIYPRGYHAVISFLEKTSFIDPHEIMRYLGPLQGWIVVLSVFYVAFKLTKNYAAAAIGTAFYGLGIGFPGNLWRQLSALPQEFAAIFILPGFYFAARYLETEDDHYLVLCAQSIFVTLTVHPYATVYQVLGIGSAGLMALLGRRLSFRATWRMAVASLIAAVTSNAWMLVGRLVGYPWHGSLEYVQMQIKIPSGSGELARARPEWLLEAPDEVRIALLVALIMLVGALGASFIQRYRRGALISVGGAGLFTLLGWLLSRPSAVGLPQLMDAGRSGAFASISLACVLPYPLATASYTIAGLREKWTLKHFHSIGARIAAAVLCFSLMASSSLLVPVSPALEYDQAVEAYYRIRRDYPPLDWTIVSPTEQYSQVIGRGWHYDLYEFLTKFPVEAVASPRFDLDVPTTYVFIYVEKKVLGLSRAPNAQESAAHLPASSSDPWLEYYMIFTNRAIIQAKIREWCQKYSETHKGIDIYYEDDTFMVYRITHQPMPRT